MKNVQSPAHKIASQEVAFPVADCVLLRHKIHCIPLSLGMQCTHEWELLLALRVEGDHIPPNYVRKFQRHSDCCDKNKCVMHGNNSALGLQQITPLCSKDAETSLPDTQFQIH